MHETDLSRRLHRLRRCVLMLQADLRDAHLNVDLIADIEHRMDHGISTDPRSAGLSALVDALRESTLTPRPELFRDAARACERIKDAIDGILNTL